MTNKKQTEEERRQEELKNPGLMVGGAAPEGLDEDRERAKEEARKLRDEQNKE